MGGDESSWAPPSWDHHHALDLTKHGGDGAVVKVRTEFQTILGQAGQKLLMRFLPTFHEHQSTNHFNALLAGRE